MIPLNSLPMYTIKHIAHSRNRFRHQNHASRRRNLEIATLGYCRTRKIQSTYPLLCPRCRCLSHRHRCESSNFSRRSWQVAWFCSIVSGSRRDDLLGWQQIRHIWTIGFEERTWIIWLKKQISLHLSFSKDRIKHPFAFPKDKWEVNRDKDRCNQGINRSNKQKIIRSQASNDGTKNTWSSSRYQ